MESDWKYKRKDRGKTPFSRMGDAYLNVWNIEKEYALINHIPDHNYTIYSIVFSTNMKFFATGSRDKTIKIWDAENFEMLLRIDKKQHEGHSYSVNKLFWSDFNNYLVSTGDDRAIMVWQIINYNSTPKVQR
jgi:WD40 repeat protein